MAKSDYELLQAVLAITERIEKKFDERFSDHETRIRSVEAVINKSMAILSVVMLFASAAVSYVTGKITGKN